mmetsp:Transcript_94872/g.220205  ORF Transcript_94872/g.220205 Transcript_94872/m.220205 type:complete len:203 (+) Transcript_94872:237-845(+)
MAPQRKAGRHASERSRRSGSLTNSRASPKMKAAGRISTPLLVLLRTSRCLRTSRASLALRLRSLGGELHGRLLGQQRRTLGPTRHALRGLGVRRARLQAVVRAAMVPATEATLARSDRTLPGLTTLSLLLWRGFPEPPLPQSLAKSQSCGPLRWRKPSWRMELPHSLLLRPPYAACQRPHREGFQAQHLLLGLRGAAQSSRR